MTPTHFTASRSDSTVTLTGNMWSDTFPVDSLAGWVAFYRRMHKKYGRQSYKSAGDALCGLTDGAQTALM